MFSLQKNFNTISRQTWQPLDKSVQRISIVMCAYTPVLKSHLFADNREGGCV